MDIITILLILDWKLVWFVCRVGRPMGALFMPEPLFFKIKNGLGSMGPIVFSVLKVA